MVVTDLVATCGRLPEWPRGWGPSGITSQTYYRWRTGQRRDGVVAAAWTRGWPTQLQELPKEDSRLQELVVDLVLGMLILQEAVRPS